MQAMTEPAAAYLYDLLETPLPFAEAVALQADLAAARSQSAIPDTVVLCEHPPTLSLGRSTKADQELPGGEEPYRALGWEVHRSERGGRSTWHGPGQLSAIRCSICARTARTCAPTRTTSSAS